jgi:hypothetical protein
MKAMNAKIRRGLEEDVFGTAVVMVVVANDV